MKIQPLTQLENFFLVERLTKKMVEWNHSSVHPRLKSLAASIVGCACVAFAALADTLIHAALTLGKAVAVIATLPFRACFKLAPDFDPVSPFIHLTWTIHSLFNIALLPFLCLVNPDKAYLVSRGDHGYLHSFREDKKSSLKQELKNLQEEEEKLIEIEKKLEEEIVTLQERLQGNEKSEIETRARKEEQIRILSEQNVNLESKLKKIEEDILSNPSEASQELARVEQESTIQDLRTQVANNVANIDSLSEQLTFSKNEVIHAKNVIETLEDEIKTLTSSIHEKQTELSRCQIENERLKQMASSINIQVNHARFDAIPPPPPAPEFKNLPANPIFDNVRKILYELDHEEANDSKPDSNWLNTEAGRKEVQVTHAELMAAIKRFDGFKKGSQDSKQKPISLKEKHISRVKLFFDRKNPDGLRRIRRHIQEMMEFFQDALDKKHTKLDVEDLSQSVMCDMGASLIRDTKNVDNMEQAIQNAIAYLETYLQYIKPPLEELAKEQKIQVQTYEKFLEERKLQEAAEAATKKKEEKEKLLQELTLGFVKEFKEDPDITISVAEDASSKINGPKITLFFSSKNEKYKSQSISKKVTTIEELDKELERVRCLNDEDFEKYKASTDYKYHSEIVEGINKRRYL